ncbi:hypothetical protein [Streptomyces sp. ML-6]|uniref:hypothetical protein n=1 Tax=Streptomyces sp. ML-6 TaxID=2982693 RepID=UPI0024C0A181|nr:hypothetical protein [Streptomyces sp. ML-6]MDK0521262.1 hypothetical protein [Streptomyces sp. ML-6]
MAVGDENLVSVVRGLASSDLDVREEASETVCDWLKSFDRREVRLLSALLSSLVVLETEPDCRESELNALGGLTETGFVEAEDLAPLRQIRRDALDRATVDHFDYLAEEYF